MTRDQVNSILRQMEQIRMESYECETDAQVKKLDAQYGRLWRAIEPYINGRKPYTDEKA